MFCSNCGKKIEGKNFCEFCGSKINKEYIDVTSEQRSHKSVEVIKNIEIEGNDTIKLDWIDKFLSVKNVFNQKELAEKRFKSSYQVLYFLAMVSILIGGFSSYYYPGDMFSFISNNAVLISGIVFGIFIFIFHMLKMSIMMTILGFIMLIDKLYIIYLSNKITSLTIFIIGALVLVLVQLFRIKENVLKSTNKENMSIIVPLIIGIFLAVPIDVKATSNWSKNERLQVKKAVLSTFSVFYKNERDSNDKQYWKGVVEETSECSVKEIEKKFPNYFGDFISTKNKNNVQKEFSKIQNNCFTKSIDTLPKTGWPSNIAYQYTLGKMEKFMRYFNKTYGYTQEITDKYKSLAIDAAKCVKNKMLKKYPNYKEFEKQYLSKTTNEVHFTEKQFESDCKKKFF